MYSQPWNNTSELWNADEFPIIVDELMNGLKANLGKPFTMFDRKIKVDKITFNRLMMQGTYVHPHLRKEDELVIDGRDNFISTLCECKLPVVNTTMFFDSEKNNRAVSLFEHMTPNYTVHPSINLNSTILNRMALVDLNSKSLTIKDQKFLDFVDDNFASENDKEYLNLGKNNQRYFDLARVGAIFTKRVESLPKDFKRIGTGIPFVLYKFFLTGNRKKLSYDKTYVTVDINTRLAYPAMHIDTIKHLDEMIRNNHGVPNASSLKLMVYISSNAVQLSKTLNYNYSKRYLWNVEASETRRNSATFGVHESQIGSLFKCREEPLSKTGRRRPILHWVEAHQRTLRNGNILEVPRKLRGITEFIMGGTKFKISQPIKGEEEDFEG